MTIQHGEMLRTDVAGADMEFNFGPDAATLSHGGSLEFQIMGSVSLTTQRLTITALTEDGRTVTAEASIFSVESPDLARARAECAAVQGTYRMGRGGAYCDRPTRDEGRRCVQDADCDSACIPDHHEAVAVAPDGRTCPAGEQLRLFVGTCHGRSPYPECAPRIPQIVSYCHVRGRHPLRPGSHCVN